MCIRDRKEYIEDLYNKSSKPSDDEMKPASVGEDSMGPDILFDEFEKTLSELKNGKATGIDGIPAEILKALGLTGKHELFEICLDIYSRGHWSRDFTDSIIIPIEKKE